MEGGKYAGMVTGALLFVLILFFSFTTPYHLFKLKLYDIAFEVKPSPPEWEFISFINIDDNSLNNVGQFPWPRDIYAYGMEVLREVGNWQTTMDIQFPDPSPAGVDMDAYRSLLNESRPGKGIQPSDVLNLLIDHDARLAGGMKSVGNVIIPFSFMKDELTERQLSAEQKERQQRARQDFIHRSSVPVPEKNSEKYISMVDRERVAIQYPIPEVIEAAKTFGFVDSDFDMDGTARRIRLLRVFNDRIFFHMGLVMVMDVCGVPINSVEIQPGKKIVLKDALNPVTHEKKDLVIPIDKKGMININWAGPLKDTFNHLSYYALLEYGMLEEEVHGFLDEQEIAMGKTERSELIGKLYKTEKMYGTASDIAKKRELWKSIVNYRHRIHVIEKELIQPLHEELHRLKEIAREDSSALESVAGLSNFINAIILVREVENLRHHSTIVGLTATGTQDIGVTPLSSHYMMVGTYPNVLNTIVQGEFITEASDMVNYIVMLLLAILSGFIIQRFDAKQSVITIIVSVFMFYAITVLIFATVSIWFDQLGIMLSILLPSLTIASVKFLKEESQRRFIKSAFGHYISPRVIDEIIKNPESLNLGGEMRQITIYFSDIAGFSTISEQLTPHELVLLLNEYLSEMTDIILKNDGTVDKYEGDAIMAFYGAPHFLKDHALRGCHAAMEMQKRLADMREVWKKQGKNELYVRMGLNTGDAVVGNMGSHTRMDYTAMGDSVNLAARLEGANKHYGTYLMISEDTHELVKDDFGYRELDTIRVVGKEQPIKVFELMDTWGNLSDQMLDMRSKYNEGLKIFKERDWKKARSMFRAALKIIPEDGPSNVYDARCTEFMQKPPSKNWDGVYRLKSK